MFFITLEITLDFKFEIDKLSGHIPFAESTDLRLISIIGVSSLTRVHISLFLRVMKTLICNTWMIFMITVIRCKTAEIADLNIIIIKFLFWVWLCMKYGLTCNAKQTLLHCKKFQSAHLSLSFSFLSLHLLLRLVFLCMWHRENRSDHDNIGSFISFISHHAHFLCLSP